MLLILSSLAKRNKSALNSRQKKAKVLHYTVRPTGNADKLSIQAKYP